MVFGERRPSNSEKEALLAAEVPIRRNCFSTHWKSVTLGLVVGFIPFLLYVGIFQGNDATQSGNLKLPPSPASVAEGPQNDTPGKSSLPVLSSIENSPNWNKISHKQIRNNGNLRASPPDTQESRNMDTYPQPIFSLVGNKTVAFYHFIVTEGMLSPDGFPQPAYLINGQSPGPEIRVQENSVLIVRVDNQLNASITFHFHGIQQRKSFLSDGVPHVTQEAIPPGGSFNYTMNLWPQVGTHIYHAHTNMDIMWLFGPLIIEDNPLTYSSYPEEYHYDEDRVFILNGVYHQDLVSLVAGIEGPIHDYPDLVNSITINGRSFVEWTNQVSGEDLSAPSEYGYDITAVEAGKRYRFRFINAASDSILSCNISSHVFQVIEMDGVYTDPVLTDEVVLSPGQRYSFIIKMDQEEANYYIMCKHLEIAGPLNGLAVLKYFNASKPTKEILNFYRNGSASFKLERWIVDELHPNENLKQLDFYRPPLKLDREYVLDVSETVWGQKHVYLLNGHYYQEPETPYYVQLQNGINITDIPQVYETLEGESVQFVFQNKRSGELCFSHPWHIHGRYVHVVGEGSDKYDPISDGSRIQKDIESGKKFMLRDTVTVFANQTVGDITDGAYCGWAAVRYEAGNSGLWLAHCHITPHIIMGKRFVIWEHGEDDPMLTKLMTIEYDYSLPDGW